MAVKDVPTAARKRHRNTGSQDSARKKSSQPGANKPLDRTAFRKLAERIKQYREDPNGSFPLSDADKPLESTIIAVARAEEECRDSNYRPPESSSSSDAETSDETQERRFSNRRAGGVLVPLAGRDPEGWLKYRLAVHETYAREIDHLEKVEREAEGDNSSELPPRFDEVLQGARTIRTLLASNIRHTVPKEMLEDIFPKEMTIIHRKERGEDLDVILQDEAYVDVERDRLTFYSKLWGTIYDGKHMSSHAKEHSELMKSTDTDIVRLRKKLDGIKKVLLGKKSRTMPDIVEYLVKTVLYLLELNECIEDIHAVKNGCSGDEKTKRDECHKLVERVYRRRNVTRKRDSELVEKEMGKTIWEVIKEAQGPNGVFLRRHKREFETGEADNGQSHNPVGEDDPPSA